MPDRNHTVTIMNIPFFNTTKQDFLKQQLFPRLEQHRKCFVVTANPEIVMHARENDAYRTSINKADFVVPDGIGILKAANWKKKPLQERVTGYDLTMALLEYADQNKLSCYFLGASEMVNEKVVQKIAADYPGITIAGYHHGFFEMDDPQITAAVQAAEPDIVFAALGMPRQEMWIAKHLDQFSKGLFIGIGGCFDVIAGEAKRAPEFWIKLNLEWLYRLIKQPVRLKRIWKAFEFMGRIMLKRD